MSNIYKAFELYQALGNIKRKNDTVVGCKKLTSYKLTELQSKSVKALLNCILNIPKVLVSVFTNFIQRKQEIFIRNISRTTYIIQK